MKMRVLWLLIEIPLKQPDIQVKKSSKKEKKEKGIKLSPKSKRAFDWY